ncbi:hypothetical protein EJ06DRAFT_560349 [Trichodelitschia bisporula]|uniref:Uncharacterized protein n=1 Tax=Trichodelitschia bisporula TaxID=703511 RepID=A0A6G1HJ05_9PEZI|nr:hypothetical protein EJ06DRAFT_560349 [Trichodelitschia bisporula]
MAANGPSESLESWLEANRWLVAKSSDFLPTLTFHLHLRRESDSPGMFKHLTEWKKWRRGMHEYLVSANLIGLLGRESTMPEQQARKTHQGYQDRVYNWSLKQCLAKHAIMLSFNKTGCSYISYCKTVADMLNSFQQFYTHSRFRLYLEIWKAWCNHSLEECGSMEQYARQFLDLLKEMESTPSRLGLSGKLSDDCIKIPNRDAVDVFLQGLGEKYNYFRTCHTNKPLLAWDQLIEAALVEVRRLNTDPGSTPPPHRSYEIPKFAGTSGNFGSWWTEYYPSETAMDTYSYDRILKQALDDTPEYDYQP